MCCKATSKFPKWPSRPDRQKRRCHKELRVRGYWRVVKKAVPFRIMELWRLSCSEPNARFHPGRNRSKLHPHGQSRRQLCSWNAAIFFCPPSRFIPPAVHVSSENGNRPTLCRGFPAMKIAYLASPPRLNARMDPEAKLKDSFCGIPRVCSG